MSNNSSEGLFVAWGLLIIVICFVGSTATGTGPVEFFIKATITLSALAITIGLFLAISIAVAHMLEISKKDDDRPFLHRLKEDYSWEEIKQDYLTATEHFTKYAKEEWHDGPGPRVEETYVRCKEKIRSLIKTYKNRHDESE